MSTVGAEFEKRFRQCPDAYAAEQVDLSFLLRFRRSPWIRLILRYAQIQGGERVLEAGCGSGKFSVALASYGCRVIALDFSRRMTMNARRLKETAEAIFGPLSENFVQGDLNCLPFDDGSFELTLNEGVVEHWLKEEERLAVIAEMVRVTKPGGSVAIFVPNGCHPLHHWWEWSGYPGYQESPPMTLYSAAKLRREMEQAGCYEVETDGIGAWASLYQWPNSALLRYPFGFANRYLPLPKALRERLGAHLLAIGRKKRNTP